MVARHTLALRRWQAEGVACHVEWQPKLAVINHAIWQRTFGLMRSLSPSSLSFSLQTSQLTATQQGPPCGAPRINKQEEEVKAKAKRKKQAKGEEEAKQKRSRSSCE